MVYQLDEIIKVLYIHAYIVKIYNVYITKLPRKQDKILSK